MKQLFIVRIFFLCFLSTQLFASRNPSEIPDPKKQSAAYYVSDPDHFLKASTIDGLNTICGRIEEKSGIQYAVVVLKNISYEWEVYDFAVELFTQWGLGQKKKDNGLLLLIVMDTHDWRFVSGYGIEGLLTDALLRKIGEQSIVPNFRDGDYDTGLIEVSENIERIVSAENASESASYYMDYESWWPNWIIGVWSVWGLFFLIGFFSFLRKKKKSTPALSKIYNTNFVTESHVEIIPEEKPKIFIWGNNFTTKFISLYMLSALIPSFTMYYDNFFSNPVTNTFVGLYAFLLLFSIIIQIIIHQNVQKRTKDSIENYFTLRSSNKSLGVRVFFFPLPFLLYYIFYKFQLKSLKRGSIICPVCQTKGTRVADDILRKVLTEKQRFEKKIRSIDYVVFGCLNLHTTAVPFPGRRDRRYTKCGSCGTKAVKQTANKTLRSATYTSTGQGQKEFTCKFCNNRTYTTYTIPMKTRSSSGSGSGGNRSGGGVGGGSWGGGRTGGGGAGGKW